MDVMDAVRILVTASFVVLAGLGLRLWWRQRSPATTWLTAMFLVLGLARLVGELVPPVPTGFMAVVAVLPPVAIVTFPYLLFRFATSFEPVDRRWRHAALAAAGAMVVATAVLIPLVPADGPEPAWYGWFLLAVIGGWTVLSGWVVWRFWSSGRRQPTVVRRRMRTLAAAAAMLNIALLLAGVGTAEVLATSGQLAAFASAVTFMLAFSPPGFVRRMWRRADERALWQAEGDLVAASTRESVVAKVLPHAGRLLGGDGALFVDRTGWEAADGLAPARLEELREHVTAVDLDPGRPVASAATVVMPLREGSIGVATGPYTPLFGRDELELVERLGTLIDLALSRAELFDRERDARANAEVARGRAEATSAELEAVLYGISHDLRTPMVTVRGYVDCLYEDYGALLDDEGRRFLDRLQRNTTYMDHLVSDLLKVSQAGREPTPPEAVDVGRLASEVAEELRSAHPDATFVVGELPVVRLGAARARQLLTNLISNAAVHSGRPDVIVRVIPFSSDAPEQGCFAVVDNGQGIPAAYRERVFGIFQTLDAPGDGERSSTGIGLAISKRIVEDAGGRIWIAESDGDGGADVRVQLPLATEEASGE